MEYIKKMDPDIALRWIADAGCSKWVKTCQMVMEEQ